MKDSFVLFSSYEDNFKMLNDKDKGKLIMAIFTFVRGEDISATLSPLAKMAYISITQQIKISSKKYDKRCETSQQNGQLGGAPKGNQNAKKQEKLLNQPNQPKNNLNQPNQPSGYLGCNEQIEPENSENNLKQPKNNLINLINPNEYDNEYYKLVIKENNNNLNNAYARTRNIIYNFYIDYYKRGYPEQFIKYADEIIDSITEAVTQSQSSEGLTFNKVTYNFDMFIDIITKINQTLFCEVIDALLKNPDIRNRYYYILGVIITMASKEQSPKYTSAQIEKLKKELTEQ